MSLPAGARLGPYEILSPLSSGGMGEVYRARDTRLGREVAVKVLPERLAKDADALARFEREAQAVASLSHPNILAIHDFGEAEGVVFAVTELLEGETLRSRLGTGPLGQSKAREHALQIARGLAAAHEKGIVHRDLKPENLFLSWDGLVKILDFGVAKHSPARGEDGPTLGRETEPGTVLGTAGYMSPEQVRGLAVDARSDIFSLGAVIYEMLTGQRAFKASSAIETMNAILTQEPPEPAPERGPLPPALDRIVRHCLEKKPEERFRSAHDLAFALETLELTSTATLALRPAPPSLAVHRLRLAALGLVLLLGLGAGVVLLRRGVGPPPPSFQQLTFRRGTVTNARFAPDGDTVVYAAAWEGAPVEPFLTRTDNPESRSLGFAGADLLSVSALGEVALSTGRRARDVFSAQGTLSRTALVGGALREVLDDVVAADFTPDGVAFAVVRESEGRNRLECPVGRPIYQTAGWISHPRVGPDGRRVAFADHPLRGDDSGTVSVVDLEGNRRTLTGMLTSLEGLGWAPGGQEVWYTGSEGSIPRALLAASLEGKRRLVFRMAGDLSLHDVSPDGRLLVTRDTWRTGIVGRYPGAPERSLSWLDYSVAAGLSDDGRTMLGVEVGAGGGPDYSLFVSRADGSPPIRLGDGTALALSPDGRRALTLTPSGRLTLVPVGAGEANPLGDGRLSSIHWASFFPDGRRVLICASEEGAAVRVYLQELSGGEPRPLTPEGMEFAWDAVAPDGRRVVVRSSDQGIVVYPVDGGSPVEVKALSPEEAPIRWSADGRGLYVLRHGQVPARVELVDLETGLRRVVRDLVPADPTGVVAIRRLFLTADASTIVYTYYRFLSELYLVSGLGPGFGHS